MKYDKRNKRSLVVFPSTHSDNCSHTGFPLPIRLCLVSSALLILRQMMPELIPQRNGHINIPTANAAHIFCRPDSSAIDWPIFCRFPTTANVM